MSADTENKQKEAVGKLLREEQDDGNAVYASSTRAKERSVAVFKDEGLTFWG